MRNLKGSMGTCSVYILTGPSALSTFFSLSILRRDRAAKDTGKDVPRDLREEALINDCERQPPWPCLLVRQPR